MDQLPSFPQAGPPAKLDHNDDSLTTTLVRPPHFVPFSMAEDPYADELAQRSAEFARHAALDDPTPPQGLPSLPPRWGTPNDDPPLAASLSLGQRFELAFADELDDEAEEEDGEPTDAIPQAIPQVEPPAAAAPTVDNNTRGASAGDHAWAPVAGDHARVSHAADNPARVAAPVDHVPRVPPALDHSSQMLAAADHARLPPVVDQIRREREWEREPEHALREDEHALPQRVPSEPDVPENLEPADDMPLAGMPQLSRIASALRRPDDFRPAERQAGFDTDAVLSAVRAVAGVREAVMRTTPTGAHHLRLELAEGADPATISRMVARMLQEQMGIDAALAGDGPARIPGQAAAQEVQPPPPPPPPVSLPGPRVGPGAAPPPASFETRPPADNHGFGAPQATAAPAAGTQQTPSVGTQAPREGRRRHPVSVPRRQPSEIRPVDRPTPTWRSTADAEHPAGATPPPLHTEHEQGPRAIIEHVQTSTFGLDATVEVRLVSGDRQASGVASGPAVDAYVLRLCAAATAAAIDDLLRDGTSTGESGRCYVEHAAIVPMGSCDVAVVVVLLVCGGWVEQLAGSALVSGDPRRAVVRATLGAVNRRLAALLPGDE